MSAVLKMKHLKRKGHSSQGAGMSDITVEINEGDVVRPQWEPTWKDFVFIPLAGVSFISLIAWCILFYNRAGLDWLLYLGWAVFVIGIVIIAMNRVALKRRGRAPNGGAWLRTTVVVDSGIYAVVRHPMYLGLILVLLATQLISQHWLTALFSVPWILFLCNAVRGEDKRNSEKFGDDYKRYMQSVPGMNLPVGLIRLLRRKKRG
jgi:protein-S-isoprenylcysteine O-methyltransferase Ste14